jgi:parvulin-like peptidyl-prolyl isomerase
VAKKHSEAPSASDGGQYDWVTRGSLASQVLDEAIFTLPTNKLSPILEDDRGFHIIRVLERQDARRTDFVSAQEEIREKLKKEKIQQQVTAYVDRLKTKTRVWTVFDDEQADASQASKPNAYSPR